MKGLLSPLGRCAYVGGLAMGWTRWILVVSEVGKRLAAEVVVIMQEVDRMMEMVASP